MKTFRELTWLSIIAFFLLAVGCTRGGNSQKLTLTIPSRSISHALSATTAPPPLQTLIANVQVPGSPTLVKQMDFNNGAVAPANITLEFDNVPNGGSLLVQVLAVYSASGGAMQLKYGDQSVSMSGDTDVNVSLTSAGGITKQSYIAGRYALPGPVYPTGTLLALFQPPGGKPKMIVNQAPILSGWFNVFAVNGTGITFDYVWQEGQTNIFTGLNPDLSTAACTTGETSGACPFNPSPDHVKVHKPASYSHTGNASDTTLQSNSEVEYVLGFFGNLEGTGKQVCYGNDIHEAIPRLFAATDLTGTLWQTPLDIDLTNIGTGLSTSVAEYMGGGTAYVQSVLYTGGSPCSQSSIANGTALILNHTLLGDNDENYGGFNVPWMMTQPFASNQNQYLTVVPVPNNGTVATYSSAATSIAVSGLAAAPVVGDEISGQNIVMGTLITAVTGTGPYTLTIDHGMQNSGSGTPISVSPNLTLSWQTLPGLSSTLSSLPFVLGSTAANHAYMTGQVIPPVGSYVSGPEFTGAVTVSSVVPETANPGFYDFTFSQAPTSVTGTLTFAPFSGIEIWAKFNVNINGTTTNGSAAVTAVAPAYMQNTMVGMPVFGNNIPANATIASVQSPSSFTLSAPATGSGFSSMNVGSTNTNGGNDCTVLSSQGYHLAQTVAPTALSATFAGLPNLPPGPNVQYQFAVCAAQQQTGGETYFGSYIQGQQNMMAGDNSDQTFGWAPSTAVYAGGSTLPITSYQLQSATAGGQGLTNLVVSPTISGINAGDQILVTVNGMGNQNACGPAMMGSYAFARVLFSSGTTIQIPSGTWIDTFLNVPGGVLTAAANPGSNFCYVQITSVLQYRTMTVSGSASLPIGSFNYLAGQLGIVPIRVNGTLTLNGNLYANGEGYAGGLGTSSRYGGGTAGMINASAQSSDGGGTGTNSGGGGGGVGNGDSGTNAMGGAGNIANNGFSLTMGGGGGGANTTPDNGSAGGGAMYIAANNLVVASASTISADGAPVATGNGGAGGGGSVNLLANNISSVGAVTLTVEAIGGGETGGGNGGAGGGGFVMALACSTNVNTTVSENTSAGAGTAHATPATNGFQQSDLNGPGTGMTNKFWCN